MARARGREQARREQASEEGIRRKEEASDEDIGRNGDEGMFPRKRERAREREGERKGGREDGEGEREGGRALFPGVRAREDCFSLRPVVPRELTSAFNLMRAVCTACKPRYWHQGCACRRRPLQRQRLRGRRERAGRYPGQSAGPHRPQRHRRRRVAVASLPIAASTVAGGLISPSPRSPNRTRSACPMPPLLCRPGPLPLSSLRAPLAPVPALPYPSPIPRPRRPRPDPGACARARAPLFVPPVPIRYLNTCTSPKHCVGTAVPGYRRP